MIIKTREYGGYFIIDCDQVIDDWQDKKQAIETRDNLQSVLDGLNEFIGDEVGE